MSIPILVRPLHASEHSFVLSSWKRELFDQRPVHAWGRSLSWSNFWLLVNHVIDKITFPSCETFVGCHQDTPETPLCWVAVRKIPGLSTYEVVYLYARKSLEDEPELAAALERELLSRVGAERRLVSERRPFNPYKELKR